MYSSHRNSKKYDFSIKIFISGNIEPTVILFAYLNVLIAKSHTFQNM